MTTPRVLAFPSMVLAFVVVTAAAASAATMAIPIGAFGPGSTLTTFTGLPNNTEVNGLTVGGILFQYSLGNGVVLIDGGPGVTNNITPPNVVSIGNPTGILTLTFSSPIDALGYGFAVLSTSVVPNATVVALFSGATFVGALGYTGAPEPNFTGGFAGIQSTIPFDTARITFNGGPAFALDNVRTIPAATAVPEPGTVLLVAAAVLTAIRRRIRTAGIS